MGSSGNHFCIQWNNHQANLLAVVSELLLNNSLTDVTLGLEDGRSVDCHKMILAACSTYFQTLFTQNPSKHPFVVLSGVKYFEMKRLIEFMYKGEVNVAQDELKDILKVADALQVKGLVDASGWTPETVVSPSPPPVNNDTSNNTVNPTATKKNGKNRRKSSSSAHSTSKPHQVHEEAPVSHENQAVPSTHMWPLSQGLPLNSQDLAAAEAAHQASLSANQSIPLGSPCEKHAAASRIRKRKMSRENVINRGTPNSKTAIKQNQAVQSPQVDPPIYPERHDEHCNKHTGNDEKDDKQSSVDLSYKCPAHSHSANDKSIANSEDETSTNQNFVEASKAGIANNSPAQANEGKRYKKYSRDDLSDAIHAVKEGMSANKAAVLFKVPSRTLYDKIKKLGYTNTKQRRSGSFNSSSSSSACFPYGIGGNVDGRIYGHFMENDRDNSNVSTENRTNVLEASYAENQSYAENRDESVDRKKIVEELDRKPSSPKFCPRSQSPVPLQSYSQQQQEQHGQLHLHQQHQQQQYERETPFANNENTDEDEAEDLSVSRRTDIPVSVPSSIVIKEET